MSIISQERQEFLDRYYTSIAPMVQANTRLYLERCNSIIQESNQHHSADTPAVVLLQGAYDPLGKFSEERFIPQLRQLAKTHYIALRVIGDQGAIGSTLREIQSELGSRPIMTLLVRAHGNADTIA